MKKSVKLFRLMLDFILPILYSPFFVESWVNLTAAYFLLMSDFLNQSKIVKVVLESLKKWLGHGRSKLKL